MPNDANWGQRGAGGASVTLFEETHFQQLDKSDGCWSESASMTVKSDAELWLGDSGKVFSAHFLRCPLGLSRASFGSVN